jgi:carbon-monoxide dehydrogenase small subunit
MVSVSININGKVETHFIEERTLLVNFIRENCRLTGTHIGCDTAQCGACTVHLNDKAIKSCNVLALQADGSTVKTIESLIQSDGNLHPMQIAFNEEHALQCGYCTPGMIMSALNLLEMYPNPSEDLIREQISSNLCRCTGYHNIVKAIKSAAVKMNFKNSIA